MTATVATERFKVKEFGNFQTPSQLAEQVVRAVSKVGFEPSSMFEPTCGRGAFILAALNQFPNAERLLGVEIDRAMLEDVQVLLRSTVSNTQVDLATGDIFELDWDEALSDLRDPLLILGNPPWITNSGIGSINGRNLPKKSNVRRERGIDAITGRGNFDISEWIMLEALKRFETRDMLLAMLCKTSVARRLLHHAWQNDFPISYCSLHEFDARRSFGVSVHACLLLARSGPSSASNKQCPVFETIDATSPSRTVGFTWEDGLVADIARYQTLRNLLASGPSRHWRSGIKHDCSKLMELTLTDGHYRNGHGDRVEIEESHVYRLHKGSEVANPNRRSDPKFVIVTQKDIADDTLKIKEDAPSTWQYLDSNRHQFASRGSIVYAGRPPFSMFGVGEYAFTKWKVAVSSFHKRIEFVAIPPHDGKPAMVDDTVYYLPCEDQRQAEFLVSVLNSHLAVEFLSSMVFWDEKRPITARLLNKLDIMGLIRAQGLETEAISLGVCREFVDAQYKLIQL